MSPGYLQIFHEHFTGNERLANAAAYLEFTKLLERHVHGDYGDVDDEQKMLNEIPGYKHSKYYVELGNEEVAVYVVTDTDAEVTTIMLIGEW